MKLLDFIYKLNYEASRLPNMGRICGGDIYELNHYQNIKYPAFCATQGQHSEAGDWRYYQFTLFYVDRLTSTHGNSQEIQSEAIDALSRIIRNVTSYGIETEGSVTYDVFTERFDSECAGAYATVTFGTMVDDVCPEWYENPVYTIRYTMESGYTLTDEDFSFGGDYGFLWHDAEDHDIVFINKGGSNGSGSFKTEENKHIATIDFSKANAPGFYLEYMSYQGGTLREVILPDTLVHLGNLQGSIFTGLTIPVTCERIEMTFTSCDRIQTITYEGTVDQFDAISKFDQSYQGEYYTWSGGTEMLQYVDCTDGIICLRWCDPGCTSECGTDCPYEMICTEDYPCEECQSDCPYHCEDYCSSDVEPTGDTYTMQKITSIEDIQEGDRFVIYGPGEDEFSGNTYFAGARHLHITEGENAGFEDIILYGYTGETTGNTVTLNDNISIFELHKSGNTFSISTTVSGNTKYCRFNDYIDIQTGTTHDELTNAYFYKFEDYGGITVKSDREGHALGFDIIANQVTLPDYYGVALMAIARSLRPVDYPAESAYIYKITPVL